MVVPMSFAHGQEVSPGAVTGKSLDITGKSLDLPAKTKTGTPLRIFTRTTLLEEIQQTGRALVLVHGQVFDVTKFLPRHPGGQLAIRHLVGKDATDAMVAFHPPVVLEKRLRYYLCGEYLDVDDGDEAVHEAADDADAAAADDAGMATGMAGAPGKGTALSTSFQPLSIAYRELNDQLRADGFYTPNYWFYVRRLAVHALLIASAVTLVVRHGGDTGALLAAGLLFGMSWHGLSFIAHDAGHHAVSTDRKIDAPFGILLAGFVGGLSVGWWKHNHNVHHIVTNEPENDPDIQHLPIFAVSTRFFQNLYSTYYNRVMKFDLAARILVSFQHYLYLPLLSFGRFNLHANSLKFLLDFSTEDGREYRWLELAGMATFFAWFYVGLAYMCIPTWWQRALFVYVANAATMILHLQITISHFAMSTEMEDEAELFAVKALRTTMNVNCPEWFDWFHGGLQFQIEHHLFPRIPRYHFRRLAPLVQAWCAKHNIEYHSYTFGKSTSIVHGVLQEVAGQVGLLWKSADPEVRFRGRMTSEEKAAADRGTPVTTAACKEE